MVVSTAITIYDAWQSTLAPFLVPACVLSAWPVFMIVCAGNRTPLKLLCIVGLVSLADGLLGSCAFPLLHQYAFTPAQNDGLFYAGSACYWLSGLVLGPALEACGTRCAVLLLSVVGLLGALGTAQEVFIAALLGRCGSATATACLSTLVEYVLYDEARLRRVGAASTNRSTSGTSNTVDGSSGGNAGLNAAEVEHEEHLLEKEKATAEGAEGQGGGMLTVYHQLRPLTLWGAMLLGQYSMVATPHISTGPCWAAAGCYLAVACMAWRLLPPWSPADAVKLTSRLRGLTSKATSVEADRYVPGLSSGRSNSTPLPSAAAAASVPGLSRDSPVVQRWLRYCVASYVVSAKTFVHPKQIARHLVDVFFGGLFLTTSLLWVPTLEMYDDSVPFGYIFQIFMIAQFLGTTFSLPVWAYGWAEAALVALLSVTARVLNTSRDYAIPVTIMLAGVTMHFVAGVVHTTGSLWRAEYPTATAPLTLLFLVKALTGACGWAFLNVIDGRYMEDVFVFEARWVYGLMWLEAVALAQYIAKRAAQHRDAGWHLQSSSSSSNFNNARSSTGGVKEDGLREEGSVAMEPTASLHVDSDLTLHHHVNASMGNESRVFRSHERRHVDRAGV